MSIVICFDGSRSARHALAVARQTLNGDPAVLLHVYSPPDAVAADAFSQRDDESAVSSARLGELAADRARTILEEGEQYARHLGVEVTTVAEPSRSSVWRTILDVADELDAGLIVAGTHGDRAVTRELLGSVSGGVVQHATRPVLVVPDGQGDQ